MRKKVDRKAILAPKGYEGEKFWKRSGRISTHVGRKGISEETAAKLNKFMAAIDRREVPEGFPAEVLEIEKSLKFEPNPA